MRGVMMENIQKMQQATPETVWAILKEVAESQKETDRRMKETDRRMKELLKAVGGWAHNHGLFAEENFFNSFENCKQKFFGEQFDEIKKKSKKPA